MLEKLQIIKQRFDEVSDLIIQPDIITDQKRYVQLNKEYKDLRLLMDKRELYIELTNNLKEAEEIIRIDDFSAKFALRFPTRYIYVPTIKRLTEGESMTTMGEPVESVKKVFTTQPTLGSDLIKGTVIHIDKYGNVIVNITERLFNEVGNGNPFTIYFKSSQYFIETISKNYHEVPTAEKLALFNESGFLEIAINKGVKGNGGGAGSLLGLAVGDIVRMEFHPKGSKDNIEALFPRE